MARIGARFLHSDRQYDELLLMGRAEDVAIVFTKRRKSITGGTDGREDITAYGLSQRCWICKVCCTSFWD